jgi:hypothetical protein
LGLGFWGIGVVLGCLELSWCGFLTLVPKSDSGSIGSKTRYNIEALLIRKEISEELSIL